MRFCFLLYLRNVMVSCLGARFGKRILMLTLLVIFFCSAVLKGCAAVVMILCMKKKVAE